MAALRTLAAEGDSWAAGPGVETTCYDSHHPGGPLALGLQGKPTQECAGERRQPAAWGLGECPVKIFTLHGFTL